MPKIKLMSIIKPAGKADIIFFGILTELLYLIYMLIRTGPANTVIKYMVVGILAFIPMGLLYLRIKSCQLKKRELYLLLLFPLLFQLTLLPSSPEMSDDIYRYIWDGKVQVNGISPYLHAPDSVELTHLHSENLPSRVNFPDIKTIYPPLSQILFSLSYLLFGESLIGLKFCFILFNLCCSLVLLSLLHQLKRPLALLLPIIWNPLIIMETAINGHLDVVMLLFTMAGILYFYKCRYIAAGILFALAIHSKLIPVVLLPVLIWTLLKQKKIKALIRFSIPFIITNAFLFLLYIQTVGTMFNTAHNYASQWYFNNPIFYLIMTFVPDNQQAHLVSFLLLSFLLLILSLANIQKELKLFLIILGFILLNPTIHPWYLILLLGLSPLFPTHAVFLWSMTVFSSYTVVHIYKLTGIWQDSVYQLLIQYAPLILLLGWQLRIRWLKRTSVLPG